MIDFWAVLGRTCVDRDFHKKVIQGLAVPRKELQRMLGEEGYILSRMEIAEIIDCYRQNVNGTISAIRRHALAANGHQELMPRSKEFCAVIGLSCIDGAFRHRLEDKNDHELQIELETQHPKLKCDETQNEYDLLSTCIYCNGDVPFLMDELEKEAWWHPQKVFGSCSTGYTMDVDKYTQPAGGEMARAYEMGHSLVQMIEEKARQLRELKEAHLATGGKNG